MTESDLDPQRSKNIHSILTICREIVLILYYSSEMLLILTSLSLNCLIASKLYIYDVKSKLYMFLVCSQYMSKGTIAAVMGGLHMCGGGLSWLQAIGLQ